MFANYKIFIFACLVACLNLSASSRGVIEPGDAVVRGVKRFSVDERLVYGRVIDQHGQPVAGCLVSVNIPKNVGYMQDDARVCRVSTGSDGGFEVSARWLGLAWVDASSLYIDDIKKSGYEFVRDENTRLVFFFKQDDYDLYVPNRLEPAIFRMRRKEETQGFLISRPHLECRVDASNSGSPVGCDIVNGGHIITRSEPLGTVDALDLQVGATFNATSETWSVVLSPGGTNGGILVSDQLLYEAPVDGYVSSYAFVPEDRGEPRAKYVYLKSRDPAIYTRLEIDYINANSEFFRLNCKAVTNPYGDRNLEAATDLPVEIKMQLMEEAQAAFRANQRPIRPDLPKLIQEYQSKKP